MNPLKFSKEKRFLSLFMLGLFLIPFIGFFIIGGTIGSKIIIIGSFSLVYLIASQALNLQVGYAGLLNLGAVAFVGIGGYTAGILLAVPGGHSKEILSQVLDEEGKQVLTAGRDKKIYVWDLDSGTKSGSLAGHSAQINAIALSPDKKTLVSAGDDKKVYVWDLASKKRLKEVGYEASKLTAASFGAGGQYCYIGADNGDILKVDVNGGKVDSKLSGHYGTITSLQISDDGKSLLSGAEDNRILVWNLDKPGSKPIREIKGPGAGRAIFCARWSPDKKSVLAGFKDGKVREFNLVSGKVTRSFGKHSGPVQDFEFSKDAKTLILASRDTSFSVQDYVSGKELGVVNGHKGAIRAIDLLSDGNQLISSADDKTTRKWSFMDGTEVQRLPTARWGLVAFYKNLMPKFTGHSRWLFFFLDPHFLAYLTVTPVAVLLSCLLGLGIGVPTLRLRGDYFAIVTLGFAQIVQLLVRNEDWLTYGTAGIKDLPAIVSFAGGEDSIPFFVQTGDYFLSFLFLGLSLFVMLRVRDSRLGRAFMAIRDDELAAQSNGIHLAKFKIYNFLISSAIASLAGVVIVARSKLISPNDLLFWESILYLCCIVLGGLGSIRGAIIGGVIIGGLGEFMRQVIASLPAEWAIPSQVRYILFAVILIFVMRFKPDGMHPAAREEEDRGELESERHLDVAPTLFKIGGKNGSAA